MIILNVSMNVNNQCEAFGFEASQLKWLSRKLVWQQHVGQIGVRCLPGTLSYYEELKAMTEGIEKEDKNQILSLILKDFIGSKRLLLQYMSDVEIC